MIEKPSTGIAQIEQGIHTLTIKIPSKKNWFVIIFMSAWICGWFMGESFALAAIFNSDTPIFANAFLFFWLIAWTAGGALVIYTISWQLMGKEIISIHRGILQIEKSVKGIGRKKKYDIKSIKNIDVNPTEDSGMWGRSYNRSLIGTKGGKIKFDYGMSTIKFAQSIEEAEARMLIEKLKENSNFKEENFS